MNVGMFYTTQQFCLFIISHWFLLVGEMLKHTVKILFIQNSSLSVLSRTHSSEYGCVYNQGCKNDSKGVSSAHV